MVYMYSSAMERTILQERVKHQAADGICVIKRYHCESKSLDDSISPYLEKVID